MGGSNSTPTDRLDGKTVIVTGGNTGIGRESCKDFYKRGGKVIVACRSVEKGNEAIKAIKDECKEMENLGTLELAQLDLSSLKSVRECAEKLIHSNEKIDILLNNAGVGACPYTKTVDGYEMQFGTNHLGHFLFTLLLIPKLLKSDAKPARVVNVSALAHKGGEVYFEDLNYEVRPYKPIGAYMQSKVANILFTRELAKRLEDAGLTDQIHTYSLHPGVIHTELARHTDDTVFKGFGAMYSFFAKFFLKTPEQGAQTSIYCCLSPDVAKDTGLYYSDSKVATISANAENMKDAQTLWTVSLKLVGLPEDYNPFSVK